MTLEQAMAVVLAVVFGKAGQQPFQIKQEDSDFTQPDDTIPEAVFNEAMDLIRAECQEVVKVWKAGHDNK